MRHLLVLTSLAGVLLLSACGGGDANRAQISAKGWDTPFVRIKPIREADPNAAGANRAAAGRMALSQAAYGQFPASINPTTVAAEMEAVPGMPVEAGAGPAPVAAAAAAPASAPAVAPEVHAAAGPTAHPVIEANTLVETASAARSHAQAATDEWYESRHVDLMPRSEWVR